MDSVPISQQREPEREPEGEIGALGSWLWSTAEWIGSHRTVIAVLVPRSTPAQGTRRNEGLSLSDQRRQK